MAFQLPSGLDQVAFKSGTTLYRVGNCLGHTALAGPGFLYTSFGVFVLGRTRSSGALSSALLVTFTFTSTQQLTRSNTCLLQHCLEFGQFSLAFFLLLHDFELSFLAFLEKHIQLFLCFGQLLKAKFTQSSTQTTLIQKHFDKFIHFSF
ncbi:hypothetical protein BA188_03315 [Aeromonas hydrophila]|nr:hypothetical protein OI72_12390 [Aeromonas hydrophila]OFC45109.1 hypothetical protein BA189_16805 [Aeromonas hydrophila]OFC49315.1 hypothetical protein BA188_03315 [Aeromonas hydrophila]